MHEGPVSSGTVSRSRLEGILNYINDRYLMASEEVNEAEATRDAIGERAGKVYRALTRIDTPHSYLRSNNERLGISINAEDDASRIIAAGENGTRAGVHNYSAVFARAGEPVAVKYRQVMHTLKHLIGIHCRIDNPERHVVEKLFNATSPIQIEHVFEKMAVRCLDKNSYDRAEFIVNQTADAIQQQYGIDITETPHLEKTA